VTCNVRFMSKYVSHGSEVESQNLNKIPADNREDSSIKIKRKKHAFLDILVADIIRAGSIELFTEDQWTRVLPDI
jgi:hypothetical protein